MAMRPISYEVDGFPEFVRSEGSARKAIERGLLTPETLVIAYGDNGERERIRAADHPILAPMFAPANGGEAAGTAVASSTQPSAEATQADAVPESHATPTPPADAPAPTQAPTPAARVVRSPPAPAQPTVVPPVRPPQKPVIWGWLVVVIGLVLVALFYFAGARPDAQSEPSTTNTTEQAVSPETESTPEASAEETITRYATREVAVRAQASATAERTAMLPRGTEFTGVSTPSPTDPQYRWLRITTGPHAGSFVSERNLSPEQPPELDTSMSGVWFLTKDYVALTQPNESAETMRERPWRLTAGQQIEVAGLIGKSDTEAGWAEIMLPTQTGVGYVPADQLSRTPLAPAATEEQPVEPATETTPPERDPEATRASTYTLKLESKCSKVIGLLLRFRSTQGWELRSVDLRPYNAGVLTTEGLPNQLVDDEIYFTFYRLDGEPNYEEGSIGVKFRGTSYRLRRMKTSKSRTELAASFTCNP